MHASKFRILLAAFNIFLFADVFESSLPLPETPKRHRTRHRTRMRWHRMSGFGFYSKGWIIDTCYIVIQIPFGSPDVFICRSRFATIVVALVGPHSEAE